MKFLIFLRRMPIRRINVDKLGLVASIDKYMSEAELASYRDEYVSEGQIGEDGSLKIFPIAKSTELMMLNKTDWDSFRRKPGGQRWTI